ncbi:MAG: ATP-grasp enzyme-like protein [Sphingobacteriaceae bacterium]|jgi:carbamoylphosphate synthase large subunit|nr:ATP-grasp enzyme-like protein [Sphingobacteriaceae bacterium]
MKKQSILLIGYDSNLCLGVIYCLRKFKYSLYLLTSDPKNAARFSRHLDGVFYFPPGGDCIQPAIRIVQEKGIDLIMPIDENEIRNVCLHRDELIAYAKCAWATDTSTFDIGVNKGLLADFLTQNDVPCPPSLTANSVEELERAANKLGFPVLVKPNRSAFGRGIHKFENWDGLKAFYIESNPKSGDFILQPFIIGSDITCNVICKEGEVLCYTIQESPVKTGSDFSSNDVLTFHDDPEVLRAVSKMMKLLNWNGVACVDMRRDQKTNAVYILEINGRFWASVVSSYLKAGVNFPLIMAKLSLGQDVHIPKPQAARQVSLKQYVKQRLSGKQISIKDTKYNSYFADPVARLAQKLNF